MMILGIDPGAAGAVALIDRAGNHFGTWDFESDPTVVADAIRSAIAASAREALQRHVVAVLERVHSMPKQGVASAFSFGASFGACRGILAFAGIRCDLVPPQQWKKALGLGKEKDLALELARRLFPTADLRLKKHHGRAEALLIAEWGRRLLFNKEN